MHPIVLGLGLGIHVCSLEWHIFHDTENTEKSWKFSTTQKMIETVFFATTCMWDFLFLSVFAYWSGYSLIWRGCVQIVNNRKVLA